MASPSLEENDEFIKVETKYQDSQDAFKDAYVEAVTTGNAKDD